MAGEPHDGWQEARERGSFTTTDKEIDYLAANGHTLRYWEDAQRPGKPARQCAWEAWHSPNCGCGGREPLPDW